MVTTTTTFDAQHAFYYRGKVTGHTAIANTMAGAGPLLAEKEHRWSSILPQCGDRTSVVDHTDALRDAISSQSVSQTKPSSHHGT